MQALIHDDVVIQLEPNFKARFPVANPMHWETAPAGVAIGWRWDGASIIPPVITIEQATDEANQRLDMGYTAASQSDVGYYMGTIFQADNASQTTLSRVLSVGSVPVGFYWLDVSNTKIYMTYAELQGLAAVMLAQAQTAFSRLQTRKADLRAASTVADVQAVVW